MKVGWEVKKLGEVCKVFADGDWIESKDQSSEGIRLIQTGNVGIGVFKDRGEKARYILEETSIRLRCTEIFEGDCLISRLPEPVGRSCILPNTNERMITAVDCTIVRFDTKTIDSHFFNYYSQSQQYLNDIERETTGTTRKRISRKSLGEILIPILPLPEQKHIVAILDEAFDAIAKAKENAEKNLQNARELFESYLQSVFANPGEGWEEKRLGEVCEKITKGSSPNWQGIKYVDIPGILFITSENVSKNELILDKKKYVEQRFNLIEKKSILKKGDVLTNIVGASIGRTAIFPLDDVANINQAVCILRCNSNSLYNMYLMHLLNSPYFRKILHENEVDNARANLSLSFFSNLNIPIPPLTEQGAIVEKLDALSTESKKLESIYNKKLADLDALKKSILQKAFNGEL